MKYTEIHIFDGIEKHSSIRIYGEWEDMEKRLIDEFKKTIKHLNNPVGEEKYG